VDSDRIGSGGETKGSHYRAMWASYFVMEVLTPGGDLNRTHTTWYTRLVGTKMKWVMILMDGNRNREVDNFIL